MFKKLKKMLTIQKDTTYSNDNYVRTNVIYSTKNNIIILATYTEEYSQQILEFVSACTVSDVRIKSSQSVFTDDSGDEKTKYYLLIGCHPSSLGNIYNNISSLSNVLLTEITKDIYEHVDHNNDIMKVLVINNILNSNLFNTNIKYDAELILPCGIVYDNTKLIFSKLPSSFTVLDLIKFMNVYLFNGTVLDFSMIGSTVDSDELDKYVQILDGLITYPDKNNLIKLSRPLYEQEDLTGELLDDYYLSDNDIDELFLQKYETFRGLSDEYVEYEELIDEVLDE